MVLLDLALFLKSRGHLLFRVLFVQTQCPDCTHYCQTDLLMATYVLVISLLDNYNALYAGLPLKML